jgi:flavin-dependent amine oxidoreductase
MPTLSRREFLRGVGLVAGATMSTSIISRIRAADTAPAGKLSVIIIGAGLAGLVAAYELEKKGHTVTILEADKDHIGGRVRTWHPKEGGHAEFGAMRIPPATKSPAPIAKNSTSSSAPSSSPIPKPTFSSAAKKSATKTPRKSTRSSISPPPRKINHRMISGRTSSPPRSKTSPTKNAKTSSPPSSKPKKSAPSIRSPSSSSLKNPACPRKRSNSWPSRKPRKPKCATPAPNPSAKKCSTSGPKASTKSSKGPTTSPAPSSETWFFRLQCG